MPPARAVDSTFAGSSIPNKGLQQSAITSAATASPLLTRLQLVYKRNLRPHEANSLWQTYAKSKNDELRVEDLTARAKKHFESLRGDSEMQRTNRFFCLGRSRVILG